MQWNKALGEDKTHHLYSQVGGGNSVRTVHCAGTGEGR